MAFKKLKINKSFKNKNILIFFLFFNKNFKLKLQELYVSLDI